MIWSYNTNPCHECILPTHTMHECGILIITSNFHQFEDSAHHTLVHVSHILSVTILVIFFTEWSSAVPSEMGFDWEMNLLCHFNEIPMRFCFILYRKVCVEAFATDLHLPGLSYLGSYTIMHVTFWVKIKYWCIFIKFRYVPLNLVIIWFVNIVNLLSVVIMILGVC